MVYYFLFPALGAGIGWFTNYLAIKFLFWPRKPFKLGKLVVQGVIPRRRQVLAAAVGGIVAKELLSHGQIAAAISAPETRHSFAEAVSKAVIARIGSSRAFALVPGGVRDSIIQLVAQIIVREVEKMLAASGPELTGDLLAKLNIAKLIEEQLLGMDWQKIEGLVFTIAGRELKYIEAMGAVLGAVIGFAQALLLTWGLA